MTLAKLIGLAPEFADVDVVIDKPTLLGRGEPQEGLRAKLDPALNRYLPPYLHHSVVDSIAAYGPGTERTSRRHALIFPAEQKEQRRFMLTDLGSTNGTFYSFMDGTRKLLPGATYLLREGDTIHLGDPKGGIRFRVNYSIENYLPDSSEIGFLETLSAKVSPTVDRTPQPAAKNYALLVGHQSNLWGVHDDIWVLKRTLESRRGFMGNIETLVDAQANYNTVVKKLERWSKAAAPESLTIFYFSGNGYQSGSLDLPGWKKLSPQDFYDRLEWVQGRKVVIIDACHSGHFADANILPSRTLAIASTRSNSFAYEGDVGLGRRMGYLTHALAEIIDSSQPRLNLKALREKLGANVKLAQRGQEPQIVGETIYLGTQVISFGK